MPAITAPKTESPSSTLERDASGGHTIRERTQSLTEQMVCVICVYAHVCVCVCVCARVCVRVCVCSMCLSVCVVSASYIKIYEATYCVFDVFMSEDIVMAKLSIIKQTNIITGTIVMIHTW